MNDREPTPDTTDLIPATSRMDDERAELIAALEAAEASAAAGKTVPNAEVVAWIRSWRPETDAEFVAEKA